MSTAKKEKKVYIYPERPEKITGYTEEWILNFFQDEENEITAKELNKYLRETKGKAIKDVRKIFFEMFIKSKRRDIMKILKEKQDKEAKEKEAKKQAKTAQENGQ